MMHTVIERRKGQHSAVHRLAQVYADLILAEKEVKKLEDSDTRHRALCFIRESHAVVKHVIDTDLGPSLITEKEPV